SKGYRSESIRSTSRFGALRIANPSCARFRRSTYCGRPEVRQREVAEWAFFPLPGHRHAARRSASLGMTSRANGFTRLSFRAPRVAGKWSIQEEGRGDYEENPDPSPRAARARGA